MQKHEIPLIEDAAEALGASCRPSSRILGDLSFFSCNGNKITQHPEVACYIENREWIEHARYDRPKHGTCPAHEHRTIGYNYRMKCAGCIERARYPDSGTALSDAKPFLSLCEGFCRPRKLFHDAGGSSGEPNYWLSCLLVGDLRDTLIEALEAESIEARPIWKPLHLQPAFASCKVYGGAQAEQLFDVGICLPSGSGLTQEDRQRVIDIVRSQIT